MNGALLTGGGDCPGLNAVIRAVTRQGLTYDWKLTGIRDGWRGLLERETMPLDLATRAAVRRCLRP